MKGGENGGKRAARPTIAEAAVSGDMAYNGAGD
jgi:hypothetical protein